MSERSEGPTSGGPAGHRPGPSEPTPTQGGSGLPPNVAGALCYLLGAITGLLFLVIERDRPFVRFHAMQSIVLTVAWVAVWIGLLVVGVVLGVIPILGWLAELLLTLAVAVGGFVLWVVLMIQAYQGREWEVPWLGQQARRLAEQARGPDL